MIIFPERIKDHYTKAEHLQSMDNHIIYIPACSANS